MLIKGVQGFSMKEGKSPNEICDATTCGSQNYDLYSAYDDKISLTKSLVRDIFLNWFIVNQGPSINTCITIREW